MYLTSHLQLSPHLLVQHLAFHELILCSTEEILVFSTSLGPNNIEQTKVHNSVVVCLQIFHHYLVEGLHTKNSFSLSTFR